MEQKFVYFDNTPCWVDGHNQALVIACSDPRFRKSTEHFVEKHLNLERFDPLFLPGGPAAVLTTSSSFFLMRAYIEMLNQLHAFKKIVGIAHRHCGYYHLRYPNHSEPELNVQQWQDLQLFAGEIARLVPNIKIECYFADPCDRGVRFLTSGC